MKPIFILTLIFLLQMQCGFASYKPSVIISDEIVPPVKLEDCFFQLDTILTNSFRIKIQNLPIDISSILLGNTVGWYLVDKWNFDYHFDFNGHTNFSAKTPKFLQTFFDESINEPYIIIRIIFRCYLNRLNNTPIDFKEATNYYRGLLQQDSFMISSNNESSEIRKRIRETEDLILNKYINLNTTLGDTLGFETNDIKCRKVKCVLTGRLIGLDTYSNKAHLFIFDIACSNRNTIVSNYETVIELYDTIQVNLGDCFNKNFDFSSSNYGHSKAWINYVNKKYSK